MSNKISYIFLLLDLNIFHTPSTVFLISTLEAVITSLIAVPNTGIESVAETLEQLWISYNKIEKLAPLAKMTKIKTLYMAHNNVKYRLGNLNLKL